MRSRGRSVGTKRPLDHARLQRVPVIEHRKLRCTVHISRQEGVPGQNLSRRRHLNKLKPRLNLSNFCGDGLTLEAQLGSSSRSGRLLANSLLSRNFVGYLRGST